MTPADVDNLTALALALSKAMETSNFFLRLRLHLIAFLFRPIMADAYPDPKGN